MVNRDTVLLVEDNSDEAELAIMAFAKIPGNYDLQVVADGEAALDFLFAAGQYQNRPAERTPALILLDISLPKLSGFDVLKRLRESSEHCYTPIVMLTTSDEKADIRKGYSLGVNSYLCKPMDFDSFTELLKQVSEYWLKINRSIR